ALPRNVVFTSGGTEANALALTPGLRRAAGLPVERLVVSAIEHASVLAGGRFPIAATGTLGVTRSGLVDLSRLRTLLESGPPALVSVMLANNETGAVQPVAEVAEIVHAAGGLLHVDAIQALGKITFNIDTINADLVTLAAHKIGGPKGVGALVLAEGIAGFGAAAKAAIAALDHEANRLERLRDRLESGLCQTPDAVVFAADAQRLPNTTLFTVPGLRAETAVIGFDLAGIAVSSGSACSSGKVQPSHVLEAMGVGPELAQGAVRLSLGWSTSEADVDFAIKAWRKLAGTLLRGSDETRLERF